MSRTDKEGVRIRDSEYVEGNIYQTRTQILGGGIVLTAKDPPLQFLDANGAARTVDLPSNSVKGQHFHIMNTAAAAFALTVRDATGAVTVVSITQGLGASVYSSGNGTTGAWRAVKGV